MDLYKFYAPSIWEKIDVQQVLNFIKDLFENEYIESDQLGSKVFIETTLAKFDSFQLLSVSIFLLNNYIITNWWGLNSSDIFKDNNAIENVIKMPHIKLPCELNSHMKNTNLLYLPKLTFIDMQDQLKDCPGFYLWQLRFLIVYQISFKEEYQHNLRPIFETILHKFETDHYFAQINAKLQDESTKNGIILRNNDIYKEQLAAVFLMESQNMASLLGDITLCNKIATKLSTIILPYFEPILTGAMGKRTKFQINELPQMLVQIKRLNFDNSKSNISNNPNSSNESKNLPKDVKLTDDTLLEKIHYTASEGNSVAQNVNSLERAYLLSLGHQLKLTHPNDPLLSEQIQPYLDLLLSNDACSEWSIKYEALYQRSAFESEHKRKIERASLQLQELVYSARQIALLESDDATQNYAQIMGQRMPWFYAAGPSPPIWKLEKTLAYNYLKMGCTNAALEIFERLNLWQDMVSCYNSLGRREKAEAVIRERLELGENGDLWCALGDIKSDPTCYEKAWRLSQGKSARAQRSLGYYYLRLQKDSRRALSHFEKSLQVVPAQAEVLFTTGCLALTLAGGPQPEEEDQGGLCNYEFAESCFRKSVMIEPDNFRAWNNLATVQMKRNLFEPAFWTLKEALKYNYHGAWQMWENLAYVSARLLAISDVIECLLRLRELLLSRDHSAGGAALSPRDSFIDLNDKSQAEGFNGNGVNRSGGGAAIFDRIVPGMLEVVVRTVNDDVPTFPNATPAAKLKPKVEQLFRTLTSEVCDNGTVWFLYAELGLAGKDLSDPQLLQIGDYLLKAYKYYAASHKDWFNHPTQTRTICCYLHKLASLCTRQRISSKENAEGLLQLLSSTRLLINNTAHRVKKIRTLAIQPTQNEGPDDFILELETDLVAINEKIKQMQSL